MKKRYTDEALRLTIAFMEEFYKKNPEPIFAVCDPEMSWIGAQEGQIIRGFENFKAEIERIVKEMIPCVLMNQTYYLAQNTGSVCTIIGKYVLVTNKGSSFIRLAEQRLVAVWRQDGERLWLMHLSNTNPISEWKVTESGNIPIKLNSYLMKYVDREIQRKKGSERLAITDCERAIHYIDQNEIVYLRSDNKYTEIFLESLMIRTRTMLKEFTEKLGEQFLKISRINIVNMAMVARIQDQSVILIDGRELPIPFKKVAEVKERINQYFQNQ
ncbi:MAG: LytTR family DNA-binding domain-containing protein [Bilifractor sp.]|nr:LytTR family DNA-binding domain-containing protein [Bilifractor sp.]